MLPLCGALAWLVSCSGVVSGPNRADPGPSSGGSAGTSSTTGNPTGSTTSSTGATGGAGGASGAAGGGSGDPTSTVLPARIRRLTDGEFDRSVKALLGTQKTPGQGFVPDSRQAGYTMNAAQVVDPILAGQIQTAAQDLAHEAVTTRLSSLASCANSSAGEPCATQFIADFGAKAYRRPLTTEEAADYLALYKLGADGATFADGVEVVITSMLQSAGFLYITEIGEGSATDLTLTQNEIASSLSYLFTGGPPDGDLLNAVKAGTLGDATVREKQARRLLTANDAKTQIARAVKEWLGIDKLDVTDKDSTVYKDFSGLRAAMLQESEDFIEDVVFKGTGTLNELLTADYTVLRSQDLADKFYKVPAGQSGGHTSLASTARRGILHQGAFLSVFGHNTESAPVLRGVAVLRRVLCEDMPLPPAALMVKIVPPAPDPNTTTRDRFTVHQKDAACAGCHNEIDGVGFTFENFDGMGIVRTTDNNKAVNTATQLAGTDVAGSYTDSLALVTKLAATESVRECFARNLFRNASAQNLEGVEEAFVQTWNTLPASAHGNLVEALVAYVKSPMFINRKVQP